MHAASLVSSSIPYRVRRSRRRRIARRVALAGALILALLIIVGMVP